MTKRMIFPFLFGLTGCCILLWLGFWQLQRLEWKTGILNEIDTMLGAAPVALPQSDQEPAPNYLAVKHSGKITGPELHVLTSIKNVGPGYRIITVLQTQTGPVLIDLGYLPEAEKNSEPRMGDVTVTGNVLYPREVDSYTPEPNFERNIWFARDLPAMAAHLKARELLVVAREVETTARGFDKLISLPVTSKITNDHREYAITWFLLAVVWFVMTLYLLWRIRQKTV